MPFIWQPTGVTVLISPLQLLGAQHASHPVLEKLGIRAVNLTAKTTSDKLFREIASGAYQLVIASPEYVEQDDRFRKFLWNSGTFRDRVTRIIFDEAHCVLEWGDFRPSYRRLCFLPAMLPNATFLALSATLTPLMVTELKRLLGLYNVEVIRRSNDRANIAPIVRALEHTLQSLFDIAFLIPLGLTLNSDKPPKFMLFMRSKKQCERATRFLRSRLPPELQDKIVWVHAEMTSGFNERAMAKLKSGELFGIVCTDVAGMGIDISDIDVVVQYQLPQKYCSLFQRSGRAARDQSRSANAIALVEPKYLDKTTTSGQKSGTSKGKKREADEEGSSDRNTKKPRTEGSDPITKEEPKEGDLALESPPSTTTKQTRSRTSKHKFKPEPVMDAFINAAVRHTGCRRIPGNQFFNNPEIPKEGDEEFCCLRCCPRPPPPERCCDICNPKLAQCADPTGDPPTRTRARPQSKIPEDDIDNWTDVEYSLQEALNDWRDQAAAARWGPNHIVGGIGIIGDEQIDRIVSLARLNRIPSLSKLQQELKWLYSAQYTPEVHQIVLRIYPPPKPPTPPPLPPRSYK
ncbi:hypothetical protein FRC09_007020 [Ceratobasidium sp. 395]|nr:hypothetical protein FRC09_007020 [Ceratobasidium sp. 395]